MAAAMPSKILLDWLEQLPTNLAGRTLTVDTELIDNGLLDSLGLLELVSFLEHTFCVVLPLDEFVPENFRTPAAILALTDRLRPAAAD
jgi:acyl carrier protein